MLNIKKQILNVVRLNKILSALICLQFSRPIVKAHKVSQSIGSGNSVLLYLFKTAFYYCIE